MKKYEFDFGVFIGRFGPWHNGHKHVATKAMEKCQTLIIVEGSCGAPRNTRNPLTADERKEIILASFDPSLHDRIRITYVSDYRYNDDQWTTKVQQAVFSAIHSNGFIAGPTSIALAGMSKDESSYYLGIFPQWDSIKVEQELVISATDIRDAYMKGDLATVYDSMNLAGANKYIKIMDKIRDKLESDWNYEQTYEKTWGPGPHFTADSCVVQSGHVLLIQRGREYGYGLWALPGGFVNRKEKTFDASLRELDEETQIKVPQKVLRGSMVKSQLFDDPYRSNRSRIITNAFYYRLADLPELPKVKGSDDAIDAKWFPLAQVAAMRDQLFEDHYDIISTLTGAF